MKLERVWKDNNAEEQEYRSLGVWTDLCVHDFFDRNVEKYPDKEAIVDRKWRLTYRQAQKITKRLALQFIELGVKAKDAVAVQTPGWAEMPLTHIALNRVGANFVPMSNAWREKEIGHLLKISEAKMVIVPYIFHNFNYMEMINKLRPELPALNHVIVIGDDVPEGLLSFDRLIEEPIEEKYPADYLDQIEVDPNWPLSVMVSSGTTGLPKIGQWTDNNLTDLQIGILEGGTKVTPDDIFIAAAPISTGATGYVCPVLGALRAGATSVILERWEDPKKALDLVVREKGTVLCLIPTQAIKLLCEDLESYDLSRLRCIPNAGAAFPYDAAREAEKRFGARLQTFYGSTEGGLAAVCSVDDPEDERLAAAGKSFPGLDLRVVDDDNQEVPRGQNGEVKWRGAIKTWGHLGQPELDKDVFDSEGYYHSGDIGYINARGVLFIVGRKKDMIIRGGQNINPGLIEGILLEHPKVAEAAVIGMPDLVFGERVCAFVVPASGETFTFEEMSSFFGQHGTAKYNFPERLEIVSELPRSAGAKLIKKDLVDMIVQKLKQEGKLPPDFVPRIK
ncbi:MAG: AMP-binding protein [Desulfobacterales bacterium]|nr:AMP-binding protein [Desulfobacterales bacterium]